MVLALHPDGHARQAALEIGARRRADDVVVDDARGVDAHELLGGEHEGTQVEGGTIDAWNPLDISAHVVHEGGHEVLAAQLGQGQAAGRVVQTRGVVAGAEGPHGAVLALVGLDALEHGLAVVEDGGAGGQLERTVGDDAAVVPAALAGPAHVGHVVRELLAEGQGRHDLVVLLRRRRVSVGGQGKTTGQLVGGGKYQVASSLKFRGGVLRRCHGVSCRGFSQI